MQRESIISGQEFVTKTELPDTPLNRQLSKDIVDYDATRQRAIAVGAEMIAFNKGITSDQRNDIVNAWLLPQLVANKEGVES